jgi:phosphatidylserine/phosphatidylglycerophosphate/cardiolipin synthase-like enzyme
MQRHNSKFRYPWRDGGRFELLVDGPQFFPVMLDSIGDARKFICLEMYLVESGKLTNRFIEALTEAAGRQVRVHVLLDAYGSQGLSGRDRQRLCDAGVELAFYNPFRLRHPIQSLRRNHRKLLLVDNRVAYVGGAGLTDEFLNQTRPALTWHEIMLKIEGPTLQDWLDLFSRTWQATTRMPASFPIEPPARCRENQLGRVSIAEGFRHQEIHRALYKHCRNAERRIWISTPYFIVSRKLRRSLRRAARHNIDVRLLVPGRISDHPWVSHASRGYYTRLLRDGVRIYEYLPRFVHAKLQLCDNWASIGSSNLDRWDQEWSLDANEEIDDPAFAEKVATQLNRDFASSLEIRYEDWIIRPLHQRTREWFWGRIVHLIEVINHRILKRSRKKSGSRRNRFRMT